MRKKVQQLVASAALLLPLAAPAQTNDKLVERYSAFAGSEQNSKALVTGLRNGTDIELSADGKTTTIDPPTKKMGGGNVNIALALAEASLKQQGITNPTPDQLKAALNGGSVTTANGTVELKGVLAMRAEGKGWGQIAQALGFKLGEVMRHERVTRVERVERGERPMKVEKPERPERVERPERPERPEKPERPGR